MLGAAVFVNPLRHDQDRSHTKRERRISPAERIIISLRSLVRLSKHLRNGPLFALGFWLQHVFVRKNHQLDENLPMKPVNRTQLFELK